MAGVRILVDPAPIDLAAEIATIEARGVVDGGGGAVATFSGYVRADRGAGMQDDAVSVLELEHYPGATEAALRLSLGMKFSRSAVRAWFYLATSHA